jgi:biotin transport system ATP-binding protein
LTWVGAGGGTRTRTPSLAPDFESGASTNSTTPAGAVSFDTKGRSIPVMELNDIWVRNGDIEVFRRLSLRSNARTLGLIGRNGAGKSTLLQLLHGLTSPSNGTFCIDAPSGYLFQSPDQQLVFPTVREELCFGQIDRGVPKAEAESVAKCYLERYRALDLYHSSTEDLSLGQKTLVCLVAVLIDKPKTILIDESFAGLDLRTSTQFMSQLKAECERVVFATHDLNLVSGFEEIVWLERGEVMFQGDAGTTINKYREWSLAGQFGNR